MHINQSSAFLWMPDRIFPGIYHIMFTLSMQVAKISEIVPTCIFGRLLSQLCLIMAIGMNEIFQCTSALDDVLAFVAYNALGPLTHFSMGLTTSQPISINGQNSDPVCSNSSVLLAFITLSWCTLYSVSATATGYRLSSTYDLLARLTHESHCNYKLQSPSRCYLDYAVEFIWDQPL